MSTMGPRRSFFGRGSRRMRSGGHGIDDSPEMPPPYGFYPPGPSEQKYFYSF